MSEPPRQRNVIAMLSLRAWLDEDGKHVWAQHQCNETLVTDMLPYSAWRAVDGKVEPSIVCDLCGLHEFARIGEQP